MARIETEQQLREIYKEPAGRAVIKQTDRLEVHSKRFLAFSPFCLLATNSAAGGTDVSPRGEEPGFVQVIDDLTEDRCLGGGVCRVLRHGGPRSFL